MRALLLLSLCSVAACSASHVPTGDGGASDASGDAACSGSSSLICVAACGSDAGLSGVCTGGVWRCPAGTIDLRTCPGCLGRPPSPDCTCEGTTWRCPGDRCPPEIDPWAEPGTPCSPEGARCSSGTSDACGSGMSCDCREGRWSCAVAEPDPVCWCGREPSAGDRCNEEGAVCGECCPTLGGPGWAAMTCVAGRWQPAVCPDVLCMDLAEPCPVDRASALGRSCVVEGQSCGNACCGRAFECSGGVWVPGPDAFCDCDPSQEFACGGGSCLRGQACTAQCGPTDGVEHTCTPLPEGCSSCECATVPEGNTCESRGGTVFFTMTGLCG